MAAAVQALAPEGRVRRDVWFAVGIIAILAVLFLPVPAVLIDIGLALSIALSVLILMVALWIQKPLEFSSFPTILLIATLLRLALGIATTRLILSNGDAGIDAAGHVIQGFSQFVMSGDFVIGLVVFAILITVNFLVITKGATRIAEVGARFTLDAIPGKQMAIDADLSAGLVDDKEAQRRRRELEEESAFFGSMDGASKFVRGEAIASLIVIAVNIFGGIIIGVTRHGLPLAKAADVFTKLSVGDGLVSQIPALIVSLAADVFVKLSVGDGLVSQIPALIVSLAAGLLVSKGGTRGTAEQAVLGQLGAYPRALFVAAGLMLVFAILPGMPFVPFAVLSVLMGTIAYLIPRRLAEVQSKADAETRAKERQLLLERQDSEAVKESLKTAEIELRLGKHLAVQMQPAQQELAHRVGRMRRKFAQQYGFVVPEIRLVESATVPSKSYEIAIHGTVIAAQQVRPGEMMIVVGDGPLPTVTGEEVREPAFGMRAVWVPDAYAPEARREGFSPIDWHAVMLTHVSEVIRNNLPQLLSYKDMRMLIDRLDAEYKRLVDEICPSQISYSGLQAVLKLLLAERVSIRNLHLIVEAVAEIVPHARRAEQIAEHVRLRIAQQICGDLAENGVLHVLRLGSRWDLTFHQGLKRDAKGDVVEVDIDPRLIEQFGVEASEAIRAHMKTAHRFALVTAPEVRSYVRMIIERLFPTVAVLSHVEIARGVEIKSLGTIS